MKRCAFLALALTLSGILCAGTAPARAATDRMAGTLPKSDIAPDRAPPEALRQTEPSAGPVAAEAVDVAKRVHRIESLGTLTSFRQGGLGKDIWAGTRRSSILTLLPQIPPATGSAVVTNLIRRALLTEATAASIRNDVAFGPGQDFTTLRLEHLLRQGAYQDALDLYSLIREKPYSARLGKAGITAMLYTGNTALACLESRSIDSRDDPSPFWTQLDAWCAHIAARDSAEKPAKAVNLSFSRILSGIAADKNYRFPLRSLRDIEKLSALERAVLIAESRFDYSGLSGVSSPTILPDSLALPLYDKNLPQSLRLRLGAEAVRRGVKPVEYLVDMYREIAPPNAPAPGGDLGSPEKAIAALPFLFRTADRNPRQEERWQAVESALALRPLVGWAPLLPFAETARDLDPGAVSAATSARLAEIVMRAGYTIPDRWMARLLGKDRGQAAAKPASGQPTISRDDFLRRLAARIAAEDPGVGDSIRAALEGIDPPTAQTLAAIAEGLESRDFTDSGQSSPYVNILPLTQGKDYVMPSFEVLDDLDQAALLKTPGDVILLSALAMNDTQPEQAYPGSLRKILAGYEAVGLHHEARRLAVEAVLGLVN